MTVSVDNTRADIRNMFRQWKIDPSEFEIYWEPDKYGTRQPGAVVRYMRAGKWQTVTCSKFSTRAINLRQIFLLLDRLRIAENHGVGYQGLASTTEVAVPNSASQETQRKETLLDAYDILGVAPDDSVEMCRDIYRKKSMHYHPDRGGDPEKFKWLKSAYELVMKSRGQNP